MDMLHAKLILNDFLIKTINKDFDTVYQWQELDLSNCQLTELPHEVCHLHNLKRLYLSHNYLTQLPDELKLLGQLESLYISHNLFNFVTISRNIKICILL